MPLVEMFRTHVTVCVGLCFLSSGPPPPLNTFMDATIGPYILQYYTWFRTLVDLTQSLPVKVSLLMVRETVAAEAWSSP